MSIVFSKENYASKSGIFTFRIQEVGTEIIVYAPEFNQDGSSLNLVIPYGDSIQVSIFYNSTENEIDTPITGGISGATWIWPDGVSELIVPYTTGKENLSLFDLGTGNYTFTFDSTMYQVYDGYSIYIELYIANRTRASVRLALSVIDIPTKAEFIENPQDASFAIVTIFEEPYRGSISMFYGTSVNVLVFYNDTWPGHGWGGIADASIVPTVVAGQAIELNANQTDPRGLGYYFITISAPAGIQVYLQQASVTIDITLSKGNYTTQVIRLDVVVSPTEFQKTMTQAVTYGLPLILLFVLIGVLYTRVFSVPKRLRQINSQIKAIRKGKIPKPIEDAMSRQEILASLFNDTYAKLEIKRTPAQMPEESIEVAVPEMGELLIQLAILTNLSADELEEFQADISKMRISEQAAFVKEVIMQEAVRAARREGKTPEEVLEALRNEARRRVSGEEGIEPSLLVDYVEDESVLLVGKEEPEKKEEPEAAPPEDEVSEPSEKLSQYELEELRKELESRGVPPHEIDTIMEQARVLPRELVEELVRSLGGGRKE